MKKINEGEPIWYHILTKKLDMYLKQEKIHWYIIWISFQYASNVGLKRENLVIFHNYEENQRFLTTLKAHNFFFLNLICIIFSICIQM